MAVYNKIFNQNDWDLVNNENKEIMEDFILELRSNKKKPSTISQYRNDIRIILIYVLKNCGNKSLLKLTKRDFRGLVLWFSDDLEVSNARTNRLMSSVRSLLDFVEDDDENYHEYTNNVSKKVKGLEKQKVRDIVFLSNDLIEKLRDKLIKEKRYKEAALLCLAYESAARKGELAQVQKACFEKNGNATNIVIGKRGKPFPLVYFDWTKKTVKMYLKERGEDDIPELWITNHGGNKRPARREILYNWIVKWRDDLLEITGKEYELNVHSFRHSALENMSIGTHWVCKYMGCKNVPIEVLKTIANHDSTETTNSYLQDKGKQKLEAFFNIKILEE